MSKEKNLNIRIDEELREAFKKKAHDNAQTPSALINKWIKEYMEKPSQ